MKKRILAIALACTCLAAGFFMVCRGFSRFRDNIISQHEQMLTDKADSVDRSIQGYLRIHQDSLAYFTGQPRFEEAENIREATGDTEPLRMCMQDILKERKMYVRDVLALENGEVILSTCAPDRYILPAAPSELFVCRDGDGIFCLGILLEGKTLSFAAITELSTLCNYLADRSTISGEDRMLLIDPQAKAAIQYLSGQTGVSLLTEDLLKRSPAVSLAAKAAGTDLRQASFFRAEESGSMTTTGYALIGSQSSRNGFFTVCLLDSYDVHLDALKWDTALMMVSCGVLALGLVMLLSYTGVLSRENRKAAHELQHLKERQKTLEQVNLQFRQLARHQRLETIGTLTASISHEFNNLLTPIMSYSLMTLEKLPPGEEELADNLIEIFNASEKAKEIISRLSDLSRKNSPNTFHSVSVDMLVQKAMDILLPAKPEGVEVRLNLNCWDLRIRANEIQITQLLMNLILNAFHAMGDSGTLVIDTTFDDQFVHLHVADSGCGIPEGIRQKIFEPFFTTKDPGKGTGLGLAIAAQVVEDHKGSIRLRSTPGKGTRFEISLPRLEEEE